MSRPSRTTSVEEAPTSGARSQPGALLTRWCWSLRAAWPAPTGSPMRPSSRRPGRRPASSARQSSTPNLAPQSWSTSSGRSRSCWCSSPSPARPSLCPSRPPARATPPPGAGPRPGVLAAGA
eukprot:8239475-Lingulodinium_polyedra.AAC.1